MQSNHRLAEKIRQMLDERSLMENRRVAELITGVQRLALQVIGQPPSEEDFLILEGTPEVNFVMARPLHPLEEESKTVTFSTAFSDLPEVDLEEELAELYSQFYVDEEALTRRIAQVLQHHSQVTLAQLVEVYPVRQGLSEIVTYLAIATKSEQHRVNNTATESIVIASLEPEKQLQLTLPQVIFQR